MHDQSKRCSRCGESKPLELFYRQAAGLMGRRAACIVCTNEQSRMRYAATTATVLAKQHARRSATPEVHRRANAAWRAAHPDLTRAAMRRYKATDRGRLVNRLQAHRRRGGGVRRFTAEDVQDQFRRQRGRCFWCAVRLIAYHVDHVVPLARGGANDRDNIVLACAFCNGSRNARLPHEWPQGGRLL